MKESSLGFGNEKSPETPIRRTVVITGSNFVKMKAKPSDESEVVKICRNGDSHISDGEEGVYNRIISNTGKIIGYVPKKFCK